jgi:hypothetical protein
MTATGYRWQLFSHDGVVWVWLFDSRDCEVRIRQCPYRRPGDNRAFVEQVIFDIEKAAGRARPV